MAISSGSVTNQIGLGPEDYNGLPSTLCSGCGHTSITRHIKSAFYELNIHPSDVVKLSGIGCSSKSTAYFLEQSFGFNAVHGRMPSVSTGVHIANSSLTLIGVSGDGDTASIGIGQFIHLARRNIDMLYLVENNGVYGLTKGQFSATSVAGAPSKKGTANLYQELDCASMAIEAGCGYVGRGFSGDSKLTKNLIKGGLMHKGLAVLDILSPCVAFNCHSGSPKSFTQFRSKGEWLQEIDFIVEKKEILIKPKPSAKPGTTRVTLHDGSELILKNLDRNHDPTNRIKAIELIEQSNKDGQILIGLFYINPDKADYATLQKLEKGESLAQLEWNECVPSKAEFENYLNHF